MKRLVGVAVLSVLATAQKCPGPPPGPGPICTHEGDTCCWRLDGGEWIRVGCLPPPDPAPMGILR
jgi:hypothetical protein